MSYRPPEQGLENPINDIIKGFDEFKKAVSERIKSEEWKKSHIDELNEIRNEMDNLEVKLMEVRKDTR